MKEWKFSHERYTFNCFPVINTTILYLVLTLEKNFLHENCTLKGTPLLKYKQEPQAWYVITNLQIFPLAVCWAVFCPWLLTASIFFHLSSKVHHFILYSQIWLCFFDGKYHIWLLQIIFLYQLFLLPWAIIISYLGQATTEQHTLVSPKDQLSKEKPL